MALNRYECIGNFGKDAEIRSTQDGKKVANFSLGVSGSWKDKQTGEKKERTEWVRFTCWSEGLVGVIERYTSKGSKVYAAGKLTTRKWQDNNGQDRYSTEIMLDQLELLTPKSGSQPTQHDQDKQNGYAPDELNDEIPF